MKVLFADTVRWSVWNGHTVQHMLRTEPLIGDLGEPLPFGVVCHDISLAAAASGADDAATTARTTRADDVDVMELPPAAWAELRRKDRAAYARVLQGLSIRPSAAFDPTLKKRPTKKLTKQQLKTLKKKKTTSTSVVTASVTH